MNALLYLVGVPDTCSEAAIDNDSVSVIGLRHWDGEMQSTENLNANRLRSQFTDSCV
ncbi:hypothetical protein [Veronia nyctiphanis]|uniref:hypothetical protein n=1 Tax=Veronia nyctiphanis TaxID=1278244 RepID=UPI0013754EFC|nr:hypothetical protein [Veronia nyctiphanis]